MGNEILQFLYKQMFRLVVFTEILVGGVKVKESLLMSLRNAYRCAISSKQPSPK